LANRRFRIKSLDWRHIHSKHCRTLGGGSKLIPNNKPTATATATATELRANDIFTQQDFIYLRGCQQAGITSELDYGDWHSTRNCTLPAKGDRPPLIIDEILIKKGIVVAFKRMIVSGASNRYYDRKIGPSVLEGKSSCIRYGSYSLPLLIAAKKDLCEALIYNNI